MRFADPLFLVLIIPIVFGVHFFFRRNQSPGLTLPFRVPSAARAWNWEGVLFSIRILGICFLIFALARPQGKFTSTERSVSGVDVMLAMDVSTSMEIEDMSGMSRYEIARKTLKDFVAARSNDRIGLVIFAGEAFTMVPPTLDHDLVQSAVAETRGGVLRDGTAIGDGLATAVARIRESKAKTRLIVLLTDGENNLGLIDPNTAGDLAASEGIRVYTIAIGSEGQVRMPQVVNGLFGQQVKTYQTFENHLNTDLLESIAKKTSAKFYRATDSHSLEKVFQEIDQFEKTKVEIKERTRYAENFGIFLWIGFILMTLEFFLSKVILRRFIPC
jgi:Ca-activated chloride channel family protein